MDYADGERRPPALALRGVRGRRRGGLNVVVGAPRAATDGRMGRVSGGMPPGGGSSTLAGSVSSLRSHLRTARSHQMRFCFEKHEPWPKQRHINTTEGRPDVIMAPSGVGPLLVQEQVHPIKSSREALR